MVQSNSRRMSNFGVTNNTRFCAQCHSIIPKNSESDYCEACQEMNLFREVRDFIRNNDVGEEDVAKYFGIPTGQVRQWLRDGRIQYKDHDGKISSLTCTICGKKIDYGNTCDECRRYEKLQVVAKAHAMESSRMRYLDKDKIKGN